MLIIDPGHTWVTDLGRFAGPRMGLSVNGALDQHSAKVANILVGNDVAVPLLDSLHLGISFQAEEDLLFAVTGAECEVAIDDRLAPMWMPLSARAGQIVRIGGARRGLRSYIAFRGGIDVPRLLGSCAPDSMIGFGTRLEAGMHLDGPLETQELRNPHFGIPLLRLPLTRPDFRAAPVIPVTDGPDLEEFGESAELLYSGPFTVSPRSNHVGLRLSGELPRRQTTGEVLSRGVPVGAIEVPSQEGLLVLHRGRGVTAGYPVLAVVTALGLDQIAQVHPGQQVRFRRVSIDDARDAYLAEHHDLARLREVCRSLLAAHGVPFASLSDPPAALHAA